MRELELIQEDNTCLESAVTMVKRELAAATGLGNDGFAALERSHKN
jgi:hypothetical protein